MLRFNTYKHDIKWFFMIKKRTCYDHFHRNESFDDDDDIHRTFLGIEGKMERLSTQTHESGFVSMHSQRSSSQSYTTASSLTSKRLSQQSSVSYNSQTFSSQQQQQLFSQQKTLMENENSIATTHQSTTSSTKSTITKTTISGNGDSTLLEKLVNVSVI